MDETTIPLYAIAHARSGDKGASANIGVIAYSQEGYEFLKTHLDEAKVAHFFRALKPVGVKKYALPNLLAFNFILEGVLEGGGSRSLRLDAQGKALGQALLEMPMTVSKELLRKISNNADQDVE